MAKEYGQLRHDIWSDDDWLNLTVPAQHLYMTLLADPTLNYCGVESLPKSDGGMSKPLYRGDYARRSAVVRREATANALTRCWRCGELARRADGATRVRERTEGHVACSRGAF